ncbi:hypothetical protein [Verrucomicrobium sp. 3C]|uniref:hypothetical protein n=1 Tax=Verrucomicrobium sp. 3C TaxID=1134055 RepID=UPI0003649746|nr:hypothetical protein [Verrucomicrobium sp. 3C]
MRPDPSPASSSEPKSTHPQEATKDSPSDERVRRTRETGRRTTAEAQERFRRTGRVKPAEKRAAFAELPCHYGIRLALELSFRHSQRSKGSGNEGECRSEEEATVAGSAQRTLPAISFRGSLHLHLPLTRPSASWRGCREGR